MMTTVSFYVIVCLLLLLLYKNKTNIHSNHTSYIGYCHDFLRSVNIYFMFWNCIFKERIFIFKQFCTSLLLFYCQAIDNNTTFLSKFKLPLAFFWQDEYKKQNRNKKRATKFVLIYYVVFCFLIFKYNQLTL